MRLLIALLLLATTAHAADVTVKIEGPTQVDSGFALVGSADHDAVLRWRIDGPDKAVPPLELLDSQGRPVLVFMSPVAGRYKVTLMGQVAVDGLDPFGEASHVVVVGKVPPPNPDDKDDDVKPEPEPDDQDEAPFPADGLHVLIVYESADNANLTSDQRAIIYGADVRAALDAAAPKRYRIYDKDADLSYVPQAFKDAMAVRRDSLPWLVISNGKTGYSGPLDMSAVDFQAMLDTYK